MATVVTTDPLAQGLWEVRREREEESAPIRERLAVVDDLLAENRAQLERLLDLYLTGDFPKEVLTERKSRLEGTISSLEKEQAGLAAYLEACVLSVEQIKTIQQFAAKVGDNLAAMDDDYDAKRGLIEKLDVQVTLVVEGDDKIVRGRCIVGEDSWELSNITSISCCQVSME